MDDKIKRAIVSIGTTALGDVAKDAVTEMFFPGSVLLGTLIGPVVTTLSEDFIHREMSKSENTRLRFVGENVVSKVQARLDAGDQPRRDDDFYINDDYGQSSASKLLEEMLLKCKQEFEAKKLIFYSNFLANICFENGISYEVANSLIAQFSSLSYQQVKLLIYLCADNTVPLNNWEKYMFTEEILEPYYTLYSDFLHLYSTRLARAVETANGAIQVGTPEICISPSGKLMCRLLELKLPDEEMNDLSDYIQSVNGSVTRLRNEAGDNGRDNELTFATDEDVDKLMEDLT